MPQQRILLLGDTGSKSMRVLEALTPLNGAGAPAVNAKFLGQVYINQTNSSVYMAVAVGSVVKADDWQKITEGLISLTGVAAPAVHADFIGQHFIDTVAKKVYVSVAIDSAAAADDWVAVN